MDRVRSKTLDEIACEVFENAERLRQEALIRYEAERAEREAVQEAMIERDLYGPTQH